MKEGRPRVMSNHVAAVVGVGPGLGLAVARKFARQGYTVAILARNYDRLMKFAEHIVEKEASAQVAAIRIDCSDPKSIKDAFEAVNSLGTVEVLVYNTNTPFPWPRPRFLDVSADSFEHNLKVSCVGAFHCVQQVSISVFQVPRRFVSVQALTTNAMLSVIHHDLSVFSQVLKGMLDRKKGTILFTGATASVRGGAGFSELACGKFALRGLSQSLARELHPQGIHVAHIIIDGMIRNNNTGGVSTSEDEKRLSADAIAEAYWQLHIQDRSAWSQEIDLRPFCEKF